VGEKDRKRLAVVLGITGLYMLVELVAGLLTGSLALLSDAGHMLSDVAALGLALFAIWFADRPATPQKTFGYYRVEILAALANGVTLVVIALGIFYEAFHRFFKPEPVESGPMLVVAVLGLVVNIFGAWLLSRSHQHSLNLRGAFLHILGDLVGSAGAIIAALVIMMTGWYQADPLVSVVIGFLILASAWTLCRETINVLLEGTPVGLAFEEVEASMRAVPGVMEVGDLHLWSITSGIDALSAHVALKAGTDPTEALCALEAVLRDRFHLEHTTIQLEGPGLPCCPLQKPTASRK
jgi:cobalt-zinc-cadmium efflux system protein